MVGGMGRAALYLKVSPNGLWPAARSRPVAGLRAAAQCRRPVDLLVVFEQTKTVQFLMLFFGFTVNLNPSSRATTWRRSPDLLRRRDARGRTRTPAHISPLCPGAFPARGRRGAKPVAPSMERRGDRLGEDPTTVHRREAMQRVPGTQRATWLHGGAMEARGYEPRL